MCSETGFEDIPQSRVGCYNEGRPMEICKRFGCSTNGNQFSTRSSDIAQAINREITGTLCSSSSHTHCRYSALTQPTRSRFIMKGVVFWSSWQRHCYQTVNSPALNCLKYYLQNMHQTVEIPYTNNSNYIQYKQLYKIV